jgi:hypothetical protein
MVGTAQASPLPTPRSQFQTARRAGATPHSRRISCARFGLIVRPSNKEGAGNVGCPMHPQPRVRFVVGVCTRVFTAEAPDTSGIPHAMVLTAYIALSPGTGLFCPRRSRGSTPQKLNTSVGVSGPHDFAVRIQRVRLTRRQRPPHPALYVRDDRETPLGRAG